MEEAKKWVKDHKDDALDPDIIKADNEGKSMDSQKLDRRTKDMIGSSVRYKSYTFNVDKSRQKEAGDNGDLFVRGFFTSDEKDEVGDIITKDATVKAIKKWRQWGNIRTMHDYPSGRVEAIGEDDGLGWNEVVTVPVDENTKRLIEGGVLKAYSVGIIPREYEINEDEAENYNSWFPPLIIHEYDMIEISYVDHPANYSATFSEVASGKSKEFSHREVLFKRSDLMEDIENVQDVEVEEIEESPVPEEVKEVEAEVEAEQVEEAVDESVEDIQEPEVDLFDAKDAALALEQRIEKLEGMFADDSFVISLVDKVLERLAEVEDVTEDEVVNESDEPEVEDRVNAFMTGLEELKGLIGSLGEKVEALTVTPSPTEGLVYAGEEDEPAEDSDKKEKVNYMAMSAAERRDEMRRVIDESYSHRK